jgi:hypothetical protein
MRRDGQVTNGIPCILARRAIQSGGSGPLDPSPSREFTLCVVPEPFLRYEKVWYEEEYRAWKRLRLGCGRWWCEWGQLDGNGAGRTLPSSGSTLALLILRPIFLPRRHQPSMPSAGSPCHASKLHGRVENIWLTAELCYRRAAIHVYVGDLCASGYQTMI